MELAHIGEMREEFLYRRDSRLRRSLASEQSADDFEEVLHVAEKQVILVAIVSVEGGAADSGAIEHLLNGDVVEWLFLNQLNEGVSERLARAPDAAIGLRVLRICLRDLAGFGVSGHGRLLCSVSLAAREFVRDFQAGASYSTSNDRQS